MKTNWAVMRTRYNWAVKIAHDCHLGKRGTVVSKHISYGYAAKRTNENPELLCIVAI